MPFFPTTLAPGHARAAASDLVHVAAGDQIRRPYPSPSPGSAMDQQQELVTEMEAVQSVVVMRHGDRTDNADPLWTTTAARPWDPPITDGGRTRSRCTGRELRLGPPIGRAFVSPFLRCVQTAAEAVAALCAAGENADIDPSKVKVSIEYGLCEVMSTDAIKEDLVPKDGKWLFDISNLEAMFPAGTVDRSVDRSLYKELPKWQERMEEARARYKQVITELANRHKKENLLIVTHGEAVGAAVSAFMENAVAYEVEYCGYVHLERRVRLRSDGEHDVGEFKVMSHNGKTGVFWQEC